MSTKRATGSAKSDSPIRVSKATRDERSGPADRSKSAARQAPPRGLILVATPIGNAADISLRALDTLSLVDLIACEDTRVTGKLMARYRIPTPLAAYHDHNAARMRPVLLERLRRGETVALVADAGTPLVSDPGYKLVRAAIEAGVPVTAVPGPSAPLAALVLSGLPTDRFLFAGFMPPRAAARRATLKELAGVRATLVLFEGPRRLGAALADMVAELGPREAAVARELTKLFEEVRRAPLAELAAHYAAAEPPKGEIVIVVGPPPKAARTDEAGLDEVLADALAQMSLRDAVAEVAARCGRPRREVYKRALSLVGRHQNGGPEDSSR